MRRAVLPCAVLLGGALFSGAAAIVAQVDDCVTWGRTPARDREALVLGEYAPAVARVRAQVPENEGILLVSDIDPAPLPYALFPRRIWQTETESESTRMFMELPPSPYPKRSPESLPVSWRLDLRRDNAAGGGELTRLGIPRGAP